MRVAKTEIIDFQQRSEAVSTTRRISMGVRKIHFPDPEYIIIDDSYIYTTDYPRLRHPNVERHAHNDFMGCLIRSAHEALKSDLGFQQRFEAWKAEHPDEVLT